MSDQPLQIRAELNDVIVEYSEGDMEVQYQIKSLLFAAEEADVILLDQRSVDALESLLKTIREMRKVVRGRS